MSPCPGCFHILVSHPQRCSSTGSFSFQALGRNLGKTQLKITSLHSVSLTRSNFGSNPLTSLSSAEKSLLPAHCALWGLVGFSPCGTHRRLLTKGVSLLFLSGFFFFFCKTAWPPDWRDLVSNVVEHELHSGGKARPGAKGD